MSRAERRRLRIVAERAQRAWFRDRSFFILRPSRRTYLRWATQSEIEWLGLERGAPLTLEDGACWAVIVVKTADAGVHGSIRMRRFVATDCGAPLSDFDEDEARAVWEAATEGNAEMRELAEQGQAIMDAALAPSR
jgi:hypothetical protein